MYICIYIYIFARGHFLLEVILARLEPPPGPLWAVEDSSPAGGAVGLSQSSLHLRVRAEGKGAPGFRSRCAVSVPTLFVHFSRSH